MTSLTYGSSFLVAVCRAYARQIEGLEQGVAR